MKEEEKIICGRYDPVIPPQPNGDARPERIIREKPGGSQAQNQRRALAKIFGWKSPLDNLFLADPHVDWTEVFLFEVKNQPLISIDLVSAYPHALLTEPWLHPAKLSLYQEDLAPQVISGEIQAGSFLCRLSPRDTKQGRWIRAHHPLRYTQGGKSHHFYWTGGKEVCTLLMAQDIRALAPFCDIQTQWGITGPTITHHPLAGKVQELLEQKLSGDLGAKLPLVIACSTQRGRRRLPENEAIAWHEASFGPAQENTHHKNIRHHLGADTEILGPSNKTAHCLFSPIRAAVRAKMLGLAWELETLGAELARVHTDGLTIACPTPEVGHQILASLESRKGKQAGELKVTCSNYGFFLGPNLWWTFTAKPPTIYLTEIAGADPEHPFNSKITLQDGSDYELYGQIERSKLLRKKGTGWKWMRTDPAHQPESRERRSRLRNFKLSRWRRFQRDLAKLQKTKI